ncbi:uncharacterized protein EAE98_002859 [Botrytis deweyae]|uniref:Uncharacterized protein n=1 Tax=Botrytis deweyae TaxID=2478750 RepID=A0ABQ7IUZ5_9HELO|nr:uncharacterized protein EAE98_002859 [Botrytis deweyae]KAF7934814.1 hypothetical protein EAE98_002859 [Botrytis deweyae]
MQSRSDSDRSTGGIWKEKMETMESKEMAAKNQEDRKDRKESRRRKRSIRREDEIIDEGNCLFSVCGGLLVVDSTLFCTDSLDQRGQQSVSGCP